MHEYMMLLTNPTLTPTPWRALDPEAHHDVVPPSWVYTVDIFDPVAVSLPLACLDLIAGSGAASPATWILWCNVNDDVTPEYTEWSVRNVERAFDTHYPDGRATDVLIAFVAPTLAAYMARVAPHLRTPSAMQLRLCFENAVRQWHTTVRAE